MTNDEIIRCLSVHSSTNGSGLCTDEQHYEAKQMAIKVIEQTTWIPVSERLPEEETDVLICNSKGQIEVSCGSTFDDGTWEWYTSGWHYGEVVAWMPLPKPYEPQESEVKEYEKQNNRSS